MTIVLHPFERFASQLPKVRIVFPKSRPQLLLPVALWIEPSCIVRFDEKASETQPTIRVTPTPTTVMPTVMESTTEVPTPTRIEATQAVTEAPSPTVKRLPSLRPVNINADNLQLPQGASPFQVERPNHPSSARLSRPRLTEEEIDALNRRAFNEENNSRSVEAQQQEDEEVRLFLSMMRETREMEQEYFRKNSEEEETEPTVDVIYALDDAAFRIKQNERSEMKESEEEGVDSVIVTDRVMRNITMGVDAKVSQEKESSEEAAEGEEEKEGEGEQVEQEGEQGQEEQEGKEHEEEQGEGEEGEEQKEGEQEGEEKKEEQEQKGKQEELEEGKQEEQEEGKQEEQEEQEQQSTTTTPNSQQDPKPGTQRPKEKKKSKTKPSQRKNKNSAVAKEVAAMAKYKKKLAKEISRQTPTKPKKIEFKPNAAQSIYLSQKKGKGTAERRA